MASDAAEKAEPKVVEFGHVQTTTPKEKKEADESIGPHGRSGCSRGTRAAALVLLLACCAITLTLIALAAMELHRFTGFAMGVREMQVLVRACGSVAGLAMFVSVSHAAAVAIRDRHESQALLLNRESGSEEGENVALAEATEGGTSGGDGRSDASSTVTMVPDATRFVFSSL